MVNDWIKSITNHLYWCAASSPEGNGNEMLIRWKSLMEHICNKHDECYHLPLGVEERLKRWFQPGISVLTVYTVVRKFFDRKYFIDKKIQGKIFSLMHDFLKIFLP